MKIGVWHWCLYLTLFLWTNGPSLSQEAKGVSIEISGHVVSSTGLPVGGATVDIIDLRGSFDHPIPAVQTLDDGTFKAVVQSIGQFRLLAWKQSAGVPDPFFSIYESPDITYAIITLSSNDPVRNITLKLPNPFGQLIGRVIDQKTGKQIQNGRITLRSAEKEGVYLSKGIGKEGRFSVLLPPKAIDVLVSAQGYDDWSLRLHVASGQPIVLRSGDVVDLIIQLQPNK